MATITTFSTLKSAVADWLDRTDISAVGGPTDTMIEMAEDQIYRELRLRFMEAATSPAIAANGTLAVPSDFLEVKQAHVATNPVKKLEPKNSEWINATYPTRSASGVPGFMAQQGDTWIFGPFPDSTYTVNLNYYARPTSLSTSNETNWLTTNASDLLLNATLLQSVGYLGMDERVPYWQGNYDKAMGRIQAQQRRERFGAEQSLRMAPG